MELVKRSLLYYYKQRLKYSHRHFLTSSFTCQDNNVTASLPKEEWPRRIVTGIQPTGSLHVGNYYGAIRRCVELQKQGEDVMVFIADLHALTSTQYVHYRLSHYFLKSVSQQKHASEKDDCIFVFTSLSNRHLTGVGVRQWLRKSIDIHGNTLELVAYLVGAGLDPERCVLFAQSAVPRHAELCWVLACLATNARLAHLPQFKEKSAVMKEVPVGLMLYPVLQAADVLVYRGTHVPVGADQVQHLQLAAQLVKTFHHRYGRLFPTPRPILAEDGSDRLRSLRDPTKKMSKSDSDPKSRILLSDSEETIALKIRKAVTDFTPQVTWDPVGRPGVSNLVSLHCLSTGLLPEEVVEEAEGLTTAQYKRVVAAALAAELCPLAARAARLLCQPERLLDLLRHGAVSARRRADTTHAAVAHLLRLAPHHHSHDVEHRQTHTA